MRISPVVSGIALVSLLVLFTWRDPSSHSKETELQQQKDAAHASDFEQNSSVQQTAGTPSQSAPQQEETAQPLPLATQDGEAISFAEAFRRKLDVLPILDRRSGFFSSAQIAYTDHLLHRSDYRYPSLIRRVYNDSKSNYAAGESSLLEFQVANHFLLQMEADFNGNMDQKQFPKELRSKIKGIRHIGGQTYVVDFNFKDLKDRDAIRSQLEQLAQVSGVFADRFAFATAVSNDPYLKNLWGFSNDGQNRSGSAMVYAVNNDAKIPLAWDTGNDCTAIPVAVLDTGIDYEHPDLKANILMKESRSFVPGVTDFRDDHYHGTHVAGTIAAVGNNGVGVSGVCWKAQIIGIKILDSTGVGAYNEVVAGFNYAAKSSAKIANVSLGVGPLPLETVPPNDPYFLAIKEFEKAGKLVIAAAGNDGINIDPVSYFPVKYDSPAIIGVGATAPNGALAAFSNYGQEVDVAAPGQEIVSTFPTGYVQTINTQFIVNGAVVPGYGVLAGTSMATPLVSGIAALFWSQAPNLTGPEVKRLLLEQAGVSKTELRVVGNRLADSGTLMQASQFKFEMLPENPQEVALAGQEFSFAIKMAQKSLFTVQKIEVLNQGAVLAQAEDASSKVSFEMPEQEALSLVVRVTDSAGRTFDSNPYPMIVGSSNIDFSKLASFPSGSFSCKVQLNVQGKVLALHEMKVPNQVSCNKFCDIVKPLMGVQDRSVLCGSEIKL